MSYIGQRPVVGRYIKLDQISSGFNGSNTGFSMTAGSQAVFPGTARNLLLSLGGVIQEPDTDFTISGSTLTFTTPPVANTTFFGVIYGDMQATGTPSDGTVLPASIASSGNFSFPEVTVTGDVNIADSIIHSGDTDTKIRFPVANQISFETTGSEAVRIDESGRVGIGHDNPSQLLTVKGNAPIIRIEENQSGGSKRLDLGVTNSGAVGYIGANQSASSLAFQTTNNERMRITSTGLVGIGTTSPGEELVVRADAPSIQFESSNASGRNYGFQANNDGKFHAYDGTAGVNRLTMDSSGNVGIGTTSPQQELHVVGDADACVRLTCTDGGVASFQLGDASDTVIGGLTLNAGDDSIQLRGNNNSTRLYIASGGSIGIGTTSPNVLGNDAQHTILSVIETSGTRRGQIELGDNQNVDGGGIGDIHFVGHYQSGSHKDMACIKAVSSGSTSGKRGSYLAFETKTDNVGIAERMRINSSGHVLVATTSDSIYNDTSGGGLNLKADGQFVIKKEATSSADPLVWLNDTGQTTNKSIVLAQDGSEKAYFGLAGNDLTIVAGSNFLRFSSSGNLGINQAATRELSVHSPNNNNALIHFTNDDTGETASDGILVGLDGNEEMIVSHQESGKPIRILNGGSERMRINSDGNVLINTTATPTGYGNLNIFGTDNIGSRLAIRRGSNNNDGPQIWFNKSRNTTDGSHTVVQANDNLGQIIFSGNDSQGPEYAARIMCEVDGTPGSNDMPGRLVFSVTPDGSDSMSEAMRIHNSGKIAINTTNASGQLTVNGTSNAGHYVPGASGGIAQSGIHVGGNHGNSGERGGAISFSAGGAAACAIACRNESTDRDQIGLEFFTHNATDQAAAADRRLRMSTAGHMFFGANDVLDPANNNSVGLSLSDHLGFFSVCRNSDIPLVVGITGSDTQLIRFIAQGSQEGNISVSGSTVSYNGGHLSRWSQIKGISTTDKSARPTIYQGTVMSNLDDLCVWSYPDQFYTEQDKTNGFIPDDKEVGDLRKAAHTEENQQLNMTKVSDTEGDKDVAGVFWTWDNTNDDYYVNDYYIAMTGDMVIRVAASTIVTRGDLLISAGDGTAKPQADDIIRSSTIAKITSTNATATYDDGSKAYPCVLMAC